MARPSYPLPRTIMLPFGYKVKVKLISAKEMREHETPEVPTLYAFWDADTQTIYIRATLNPAARRYMLSHEFHHAVLDWQHEMLDRGVMAPPK